MQARKGKWKCVGMSLAALALAGEPDAVSASDWSDTFIGYQYQKDLRFPGNPNNVKANVLQFQHVSGYKYGHNFFNVNALFYDGNKPAINGTDGSTEVYLVYRHELSLSAVTGNKISFGPVRDVGITAGLDVATNNDLFGGRPIKLSFGPTLEFDVPGYLNVGLWRRTERNHNGIPAPGVRSDFRYDPHWVLATAYGIRFNPGVPAIFKGWAEYTGRKGKDGFGNPSAPETFIDASLMFDLVALSGKRDTVFLGLGYQYRNNIFGVQEQFAGTGTKLKSWQLRTEWHF